MSLPLLNSSDTSSSKEVDKNLYESKKKRKTQVVGLEGDKLFGIERYDLDVLVVYFTIIGLFIDVLRLKILDDEMSIVVFQIVEDDGKEVLVTVTMCRGRFQLEITIITTGKEELTCEVTMVTDLPISVSEGLFAIVADGGVGVLWLLLGSKWFHWEVGDMFVEFWHYALVAVYGGRGAILIELHDAMTAEPKHIVLVVSKGRIRRGAAEDLYGAVCLSWGWYSRW